ncbi:hypothetical protein D3C72_521730 [compost metagenome]
MRNGSNRVIGVLVGALAVIGCAEAVPPTEPVPLKGAGEAAARPSFGVSRGLLQATVREGIPNTNGCYEVGDERVKFMVITMRTKSKAAWDETARSVSRDCDKSRVWDDRWYYYSLPDDGSKHLMLLWKNLDTGKYGYAGIMNFPTWWGAFTNSTGSPELIPYYIPNGQQKKLTWTTNGKQIDIDIRNPENTGPWTANDIWVSFGYPN